MTYIPVFGLEIHAELLSASKVYCTCKNEFGGKANTRVCPRCMALPGTLPILNMGVVKLAAKAGIATDCTVNNLSSFDRKNYFYPDLPKAYQITQFEHPICTNGHILLRNGSKIRIKQIHIEEDAGKLTHDDENNVSLIDYNRCGVPLIEIVTEPDFRSINEVKEFVTQIALRLKYADICDARMEQGSLRVDVNISIMNTDDKEFGTRTEIKNLNSFRSIERAINYEIKRQSEILNNGNRVIQETRRFDENSSMTFSLRSKEDAHDYRYFPDPDIPDIFLSNEDITTLKASMPELPHIRFERYTKQYGLSEYDADVIIQNKLFSDFYDACVKLNPSYKLISNLMTGELNRKINDTGISISSILFSHVDLAELAKMSADGIVSVNSTKDILSIMFDTGGNPMDIARENGFIMSNNTSETELIISVFLEENAESVDSYKNGNEKIFGFFMGQLMRKIGKSANPILIKEILEEKLK